MWGAPIVAVWAAILLVYGGFIEDDAFISFRYARNLALGHGFTFNPGEIHFGTSAPLFAAFLGVIGKLSPASIPALGVALSALGLLACAFAVLAFWWDSTREVGLLAGILIVGSPLTYYSFGMEMSTQAALVLWGFYLCRIGRPVRGNALLALAVLVRPDAIVALAIGLGYAALRRRTLPIRELAVSAGVLIPAAVILYAYFGTALPATAAAKQAQVESGVWQTFIPGTIDFLRDRYVVGRHMPICPVPLETINTPLPGWPLWLALAAVGGFFGRRAALPLLWAAGMTMAYQVGRVTFNDWYIFPVGIGLSVLVACAFARLPKAAVLAACGAAGMFLVWYAGARAANCIDGRTQSYIEAAKWLSAHTQPDDRVGFCELGYIGWFCDRPMVDPLGLVHEGLDSHVSSGNFGYAYRKRQPEFILDCSAFNRLFEPDHTRDWMQQNYAQVATFHHLGYPPVTVWKREPRPLAVVR